MRRIFITLFVAMATIATISADGWGYGYCMNPNWGNNTSNNNGDYFYGPGMMWGNGGSWLQGQQENRASLNLTQEQQRQWNDVENQSNIASQAVNDSINYYVQQIARLHNQHSNYVQQDLNRIKSILTPQQYNQFL